jgi:hypothetical protein
MLISRFLDITGEHRRFLTGWKQELPEFYKCPFNFFVNVIFVMLAAKSYLKYRVP